jgi:hypothetical protein
MNGLLLGYDTGAGHRTLDASLSGIRAATQKSAQKSRLMARAGVFARQFAAACLLLVAAAVAGAVPAAFAADSLVGGDRPDIRQPRVAPSPGVQRPATGAGSSAAAAASNCRSRCGSACQTMSCSGLNTSQCLSIRQNCRMNCSSRC